jgi:HrpA-like RNA helicase
MQVLEEHWAVIEDQGPPNMDDVLKHLVPPQEVQDIKAVPTVDVPARSTSSKTRNVSSSVGQELRSDAEVMQEFDAMRQDARYGKMYATRRRLPAFASKDDFLAMLGRSRVVVVVGETGSGKTTQCERVPERQTRYVYS